MSNLILENLPWILALVAVSHSLYTRLLLRRFILTYKEPFEKNQRLMEEISQSLERLRAEGLKGPSKGEIDQLSVDMVEKMLIQGLSEEEAKRAVLEKYQRLQFDLEDH